MTSSSRRRTGLAHTRPLALMATVGLTISLALAGAAVVDGPAAGAAAVPLSVKVVGNHFVDGSGHAIRLLGVNHTSAEYGCVDGFGYDDGHFDDADARAIASWHADAVRIPLNEDCWLGLNGEPNSSQGADPALTKAGYRREVAAYVADLNRYGIYAILDLHWSAPGMQVALEQQPMPDQDHAPAFWTSVASTFSTNHAVVFDLFNEPYDPTDPRSGTDTNPSDTVTWNCWKTGTHDGAVSGTPCYTSAYENARPTSRYRVAGMQTLLDAVRATGAKQPVLVGGLDYANDLGDRDGGRDWLDHAPVDPLHQEAASFHNYQGKTCDTPTCWKTTIAPIAAHVPVVTGEFAEDNYLEAKCPVKTPTTFDAQYMTWADSAGVSYLAWGWIVEPKSEMDSDGCSAFTLIDFYTAYAPSAPNGTAVHDHLVALATAKPKPPVSKPPAAVTLTTFGAAVRTNSKKVGFTLRSPETATGTLTGRTVHAYKSGKGKRHQVSLGTVHVSLAANRTRTAVLTLAKAFRTLLVARKSLTVTISITLTSPHHKKTVITRRVTLTAARHHA